MTFKTGTLTGCSFSVVENQVIHESGVVLGGIKGELTSRKVINLMKKKNVTIFTLKRLAVALRTEALLWVGSEDFKRVVNKITRGYIKDKKCLTLKRKLLRLPIKVYSFYITGDNLKELVLRKPHFFVGGLPRVVDDILLNNYSLSREGSRE